MTTAKSGKHLILFSGGMLSLLLALLMLTPYSRSAKAQGDVAKPNSTAQASSATAPPTDHTSAPASGSPSQPPPKAPSGGKAAAEAADEGKEAEADASQNDLSQIESFLEPFIYDTVNRRDPFMAYAEFTPQDSAPTRPLSAAQRFDLDQLHLVAVMWDVKDPKAMFMDPENEVLVLGRDEGIGNKNGYIAAIREGEVVVVEAIRRRGDIVYKTRVLRIER